MYYIASFCSRLYVDEIPLLGESHKYIVLEKYLHSYIMSSHVVGYVVRHDDLTFVMHKTFVESNVQETKFIY
jgi:hypothetical protein